MALDSEEIESINEGPAMQLLMEKDKNIKEVTKKLSL